MNYVANEIRTVLKGELIPDDIIQHYGTKRHSGRYPWGSGKNPYQHASDFYSAVNDLRKKGYSDEDIAKRMGMEPGKFKAAYVYASVNELKKEGKSQKDIAEQLNMSTGQLRTLYSYAKNERDLSIIQDAKKMRDEGMSNQAIADKLGIANESTIRTMLANEERYLERIKQARSTADFLKDQIDQKGMIDVGSGTERQLNISQEKLKEALYILEMEGYPTYTGGMDQVTNPGQRTHIKVVCPPGTEHKDIFDLEKINSIEEYTSHDDGKTFSTFQYPRSLDSKRLMVRYAEDGGIDKDGLIELRPGVKDISLGDSTYAQVRIMVDGTHYLKGMAVYNDNLPKGVDVVFNTNKKSGTPALGEDKNNTVLKHIKDDPDNPFGSLIKEKGGQSYYIDENGKEKLSLINKRAEEGDWGEWSKTLPSQFLAKQNLPLVKKQLQLSKADKKAEFDTIMSLENPTIRRHLLSAFAKDCDKTAETLKAASLPRTKYQVIIPLTSIKDNEVYAPNYKHGEKVALIRYPHGGTFEIPILTVNNKVGEGKKIIGNAPLDAIGISSKVAERLSGADFDGDTVMVIPHNDRVKITSTPPLKGLEGFDPKMEYPGYPGMKVMKNTDTQMGIISNLITDMTIQGAPESELARAVRHSMVVIDAQKHELDYRRSEKENKIKELKDKYQRHYDSEGNLVKTGGVSTLLSKAKSEERVLKRVGTPTINKDTGELEYKTSREVYKDRRGVEKYRTTTSTKMAETKDAYTLSSGSKVENYYADYANYMKHLANTARKETVSGRHKLKYSPDAAKQYANEVASLNKKLNDAMLNAPRERKAQYLANVARDNKKKEYPDLTKKELKKISQQELTKARAKVGAVRKPIDITDKEWEAIQKGAITDTTLTKIFNHTDQDSLKQRAMPRQTSTLSSAKQNLIKSYANSGYTIDEISKKLGVSASTVNKYVK